MELVLVPSGRFEMGSPAGEEGREEQETRHTVVISRPFYIGRFEVTQSEWRRVMGANPSFFAECDDCPVERVNRDAVLLFLDRLNDGRARARFRLPTEAEWEYACRAGASTAYASGDSLTAADANADGERTSRVGSYPPNAWGLHDMHGNVWEWTEDRHCPYPTAPVTDPVGTCASPLHVIRGGSFHFGAESARCALRYTHAAHDSGFSLGFRVARDVR